MNKLKMISLLTALSLLLVFFASCGTDDTSSSGGSKNDSQNADDSSSSTTDESQPPKEFSNATIVSQGKTYTASVAAGKGYEDTYNSELTDGILSASENADYTDKKFSGYAVDNSSLITFIIDLGKEYDNLYMFAVDYLCTNKVGIGPPSSISVHVSADNKKWDRLGLCKLPKSEEGTTKQAVLKLDKTVTGRYIKFAVSKSSAWTFLDELIVYADVPSESNDADLQNAISEIYKNDKNDYAAAIAALKSGNIDFSKPKIPVSITSHYEFSQTPLQKYNDSAKVKLTDNNICGYYESGSWVGFGDGKDVDITIELPQKRDDISQFTLDTYSNKTIGIYFPSCVMISVSSDNKTFTPVGRIFAPANSNLPTFTYSLVLDCAISAKYVRYTLKSFGKNIMLAEEATVYSYAENKEPETMYPQLEFPNITKPEFFPSSDKNFNDRINLIFNKTQQISVTTEPEKTYWDSNSPITSTLLTDGKFSTTNDLHNGSFFKFCRGSHRNVIYDLGKSCAIDTFTASFTNK
ncbi:MAG: discoidin domain-containing protein, partial [Clostridia bacterium]